MQKQFLKKDFVFTKQEPLSRNTADEANSLETKDLLIKSLKNQLKQLQADHEQHNASVKQQHDQEVGGLRKSVKEMDSYIQNIINEYKEKQSELE